MSNRFYPTEVLLVGSSPLASAEEFFCNVSDSLPSRLQQIPDGECGSRNNFIAWQHGCFPITIVQPRWGGQPSAESSAKSYTLEDVKPTGYDDQAMNSFRLFRELKNAGKVPTDARFQVSLPTPFSVVRGFVEDDGVCAKVEPLYEERISQALCRLQEYIPASELTIQWDLPAEVATLEYELGRITDKYWKSYFSPLKDGIWQRLVRLAKDVNPDVQMGYHLCYGDFGHVHFVQPSDLSLLVDLANGIMKVVNPVHHVAYFHMPVPKERTDGTFFSALKDLKLNDTKLHLGVVHAHDMTGTKDRLEAASKVYPNIAGVSTECGLGRTSKEDVKSVLEICASITGPRV